MKRRMNLVVLTATLFLLTACQTKPTTTTETETLTTTQTQVVEQATIRLEEDGKELLSKEVSFSEGATLYEVMQANFEIADDDGFITAIDQHEQNPDKNKYWVFEINDEQVMKGAKEVQLQPADKVVFKLEKF